jgi:hypothetical protein
MGICNIRIVVEFPEDAETSTSDLKLSPDIRAVNYPALETRILEIVDKLEVEEDAEE